MGKKKQNDGTIAVKSVKFNLIMNVILTLSSFIFPLITFPYVSRILLPEGTGKVDLATSVVTYFSMIASMGVPTYGIRACAKVRDNKEELSRVVQEILLINFALTAMVYLVYFWSLFHVEKIQNEAALYSIMSLTIIFNVIGVEWLYKGLEQYSYITVRSIIFKFLALILMFLFIHQKSDYIIYGGITIFAGVGSNIFNFINLRKFIYLHPVKKYRFRRHFKAIFIFFAMSVATTIYTNLDNVMLGFMTSATEVGYYGASVKIKTILVTFVTSLGPVLLPRATYYIEHGMLEEFKVITKKAFHFVWILAIPVMTYFIIMARESILLLSGEAYLGSVIPMKIIMPTVLFIGITNVIGIQILIPLGKEKIVFISEVVGAVVDLVINAALIPEYGAAGAAMGTVVAELSVLGVQIYAMRNSDFNLMKGTQIWKIITATVVSTAACLWIREVCSGMFSQNQSLSGAVRADTVGLICVLVLTAGAYFICYGVILAVTKETLFLEITGGILQKVKRR